MEDDRIPWWQVALKGIGLFRRPPAPLPYEDVGFLQRLEEILTAEAALSLSSADARTTSATAAEGPQRVPVNEHGEASSPVSLQAVVAKPVPPQQGEPKAGSTPAAAADRSAQVPVPYPGDAPSPTLVEAPIAESAPALLARSESVPVYEVAVESESQSDPAVESPMRAAPVPAPEPQPAPEAVAEALPSDRPDPAPAEEAIGQINKSAPEPTPALEPARNGKPDFSLIAGLEIPLEKYTIHETLPATDLLPIALAPVELSEAQALDAQSLEPVPLSKPDEPSENSKGPLAAQRISEPIPDLPPAQLPAAEPEQPDENAGSSTFSISTDQTFESPLDLLLDLIRSQNIDIRDIPIARVSAQFSDYLDGRNAAGMPASGEFIYAASLLKHIKSKEARQLTRARTSRVEEDPRHELVERLLEHERVVNTTKKLPQKQELDAETASDSGDPEPVLDAGVEPEIAADTNDLIRVFREILDRARKRPVVDLKDDTATVGQMIQFLVRRLSKETKPVALRSLVRDTHSEGALGATFLALLELVRLRAIVLWQDRAFTEIFVEKQPSFDAATKRTLANARADKE